MERPAEGSALHSLPAAVSADVGDKKRFSCNLK